MMLLIKITRLGFSFVSRRQIATSSILAHNKQAGRHFPSIKQDKPLTYEMSFKPSEIANKKTQNSQNTSNLFGLEERGLRPAETVQEDFFIRKFMFGTWHKLFLSDVVIKRRGNIITLTGIVRQGIHPRKVYFLIGYTEQLLSQVLKCPIKMDIQTLADPKKMIFKYV